MNSSFTPVRQTALSLAIALSCATVNAAEQEIDEIVIWGSESDKQFTNPSPTSVLTPEDFKSINVATTEDVVKFEPSIVIRRRFIGDANGVVGMRGSNMFQTSRSMVFADGVPLHYLLQSRWNGAPRWTMVSASEIAQVNVLYGPFSAEYSGNSMGGVIEIETAIPQKREFHFDSSYFVQNFDAYGFDDSVSGYKSFASFGDKIGNTSVYFSLNRLENESQPQTFRFGGGSSAANPVAVTGAIVGNDELGTERRFFMDTGIIDSETNNYKFKLGHDFGNWSALLNIAFEDRSGIDRSPNTYLRDGSGNPVYRGNVVQDGVQFSVPASRFAVSNLERRSLSSSLRLRGNITDSVELETNINSFSVLRDETRSSSSHPNDPAHTPDGQVSDFGDTGWNAAEAKLTFNELGVDGLALVTGVRYESYELNLDIFESDNYVAGSKDRFSSRSGGETEMLAAFAQLNWQFSQNWDASLGLRFEDFESKSGYFNDDDPATPEFDLTQVPARSSDGTSPKFSLGYTPSDLWSFRYSAARAYRFPIVEELFSQFEAFNSISIANPGFEPEDGIHHNLMAERAIPGGYVRVNYFTESIRDVIESQTGQLENGVSIRTFLPVGEIETSGLEFIVNANDVLIPNLALRFNSTYTDSEIVENRLDPSIEGNAYPRMPKWRGNLLANYQINPNWDAGINYQYASDSFGRTDNRDLENNVFGAQDGISRLGAKSTYKMDNGLGLGFGVDNITDEVAYVAHPWPGRSYYFNLSYDLK
jgi:iron complex outermembrane recepter protein